MLDLNDEQKEVVYSNRQFLFLLAGAGTGKTRTIVERIKYIINNNIALKSEILCITFTKKTSYEMKKRINEEMDIYTFHSFCLMQLKRFTKYDKRVFSENELELNKEILLNISRYKNQTLKKKPFMFDSYQAYLYKNNLIDFDDLEGDFFKMLEDDMIRKIISKQYKYIFIDEFQDTNNIQYEIIKKIVTKQTHVLAVGDPDQNIYSFRGANQQIIFKFIKDFQADTLTLTINYRSYGNIIKFANSIIGKNKNRFKKELIANNQMDGRIMHKSFNDEYDEADFIIDAIKKLVKERISYEEIAILYRNHDRINELVNKLSDSYIPFKYKESLDLGISLMTIHQAKGLEFDCVFIVGLEGEIFPAIMDNRISELYEERRLFFVGITRARKQLFITCSKQIDRKYRKKSLFYRESEQFLLKEANKTNKN